jgi:hypothetical protein
MAANSVKSEEATMRTIPTINTVQFSLSEEVLNK